ncbi:MAG: SRPBCC family protein [Cytophagaceae bacterium]|nr:SRPBCC family protein [Cytophagaceae bacterium]
MKKFLLWSAGISLSLFIIFIITGASASENFEGTETRVVNASSGKIWNYLTDIEGLPRRRKEIVKVEMLGKNEKGLDKWKEIPDMGGYILFEQLEKTPLEKLTLNMIESSFNMKGTWTYELKEAGQGKTTVKISEKSTIESLFIRSIMTLSGRDGNIKREFEIMESAVSQ